MKLTLFLYNGTIRGYVKPEGPDINDYDEDCGYAYDCRRAEEAAKDAALEVENWKDFFSIERDGLWSKTKGGGFERMIGEEIALPESIGWEIIEQARHPGKDWFNMRPGQVLKGIVYESRQIIRLKRWEPHTLSNAAKNIVDQTIVKVKSDEYNKFKADRKRSEPVEKCKEWCKDMDCLPNDQNRYFTEDSSNCRSEPVVDAVEHKTQEAPSSKFSNSEIGSHHWSATVLSYIMRVGEYLNEHGSDVKQDQYYRGWGLGIKERAHEVNNFIHSLPDKDQPTPNTDTQESQTESAMHLGQIIHILYEKGHIKGADEILEKFTITRKA